MCISTMIRPAYEVPDQGFKPVYFFCNVSFLFQFARVIFLFKYLFVGGYVHILIDWANYLSAMKLLFSGVESKSGIQVKLCSAG